MPKSMNRRQLLEEVRKLGLDARDYLFLYWVGNYGPECERNSKGNRVFTQAHVDGFVTYLKRRQSTAVVA